MARALVVLHVVFLRRSERFYNNGSSYVGFFGRNEATKLVFFVAIVAWENGDDGKCSPQWNDLGHFAELN